MQPLKIYMYIQQPTKYFMLMPSCSENLTGESLKGEKERDGSATGKIKIPVYASK